MSASEKTTKPRIVVPGTLTDELKSIVRDEFLFVGEGLIGVRDLSLDPDELCVEVTSHVERGKQLLELADGVLWRVPQSGSLIVRGRERCVLAAELLTTLRESLEKELNEDEVEKACRDALEQRIARIQEAPELNTDYWVPNE